MNFSNLIELAEENRKNPTAVKCFSTVVAPAKKTPRNNVPSANIQKFLQKKEQEERQKEVDAKRSKERLLMLRAMDNKNNKKAKLMASRTKDNNFSKIRLTEQEVESKQKVEASIRRQQLTDKVERMKARIKMEELEQAQPHKRKRRPKSDNPMSSPEPDRPQEKLARYEESVDGKMVKKKRPVSQQAPMSFSEIMRLAALKQTEAPGTAAPQPDWEDFDENEEDADDYEENPQQEQQQQVQPMTKRDRLKQGEERASVKRKESSGPAPKPAQNGPRRDPQHQQQRPIPQANRPRPGPPQPSMQPGYQQQARIPKRPPVEPPRINQEQIPSYTTITKAKSVSERNAAALQQVKVNRAANKGIRKVPHGSSSSNRKPAISKMATLPDLDPILDNVPSYNTVKKIPQSQQRSGPDQRPSSDQRPSFMKNRPVPAKSSQQPRPSQVPSKQNPMQSRRPPPTQEAQNNSRMSQNGGRPPQNNIRPAQNNLRPAQNNLRPGQNNVRPPQNNVRPPQNNVRPPQNNVRPPQNNLRPPQNNLRPPQSSQNNIRPSQNNVRPAPNPKGVQNGPGSSRPLSAKPGIAAQQAIQRRPQPQPGRSLQAKQPPMRHEPWPNLARNPYKKLPPITCSRPNVRRIESDDEEDDEEMNDFIDDQPMNDLEDYSKHIREIFGYDKRKYTYADDEYEDEVVETTFAEQMKEENRSARIALQEDLEEYHRELEMERAMKERKKKK